MSALLIQRERGSHEEPGLKIGFPKLDFEEALSFILGRNRKSIVVTHFIFLRRASEGFFFFFSFFFLFQIGLFSEEKRVGPSLQLCILIMC
jgi:hypothetical protein